MQLMIEDLWDKSGFSPNEEQRKAIKHLDGPLFLTAGPGSGKTRVLLWRTLNLVVFHDIHPKDIFLSTFTEKAAKQLKDGLRSLLGFASNFTNKPYDISRMYVGTVHSNCQSIISDRRFSNDGTRSRVPVVMDELDQYFYLYAPYFWLPMLQYAGLPIEEGGLDAHRTISQYLNGRGFGSRHNAVQAVTSLFNRLSEEDINPKQAIAMAKEPVLQSMLKMYEYYLTSLSEGQIKSVDLSLLQQAAFRCIENCHHAGSEFKHIIIDEYQDTNTIQEKIFFRLASGHKNICVVGDDDQALYRFRGATVENLVEFEERCVLHLGSKPVRIDLDTNYRSRKQIVDFYTNFISRIDWLKKHPERGAYRVIDKRIKANSKDDQTAVLVSSHAPATDVYTEVAGFVKKLKASGKIEDYNQCAFLFPAMKGNSRVEGFKLALEAEGISVYAPRAGNFFDVDEVRQMMGCILHIFDRPHYGNKDLSAGIKQYRYWMIGCMQMASALMDGDYNLKQFIKDKRLEIADLLEDYQTMMTVVKRKKWDIKKPATDEMVRAMITSGASQRSLKNIQSGYFLSLLRRRSRDGNPVTLEYVINRATSIDWSVLDLFYQFCSFDHFRHMFDVAEQGKDEGYVCNLALLSEYLGLYLEKYSAIITAASLEEQKFNFRFFGSYFYALYRLGQSEYEDQEVPFPKGRVPFLTIHQSKGLEFPVVVLGSVYRGDHGIDTKEEIVRKLVKKIGEPLDRMANFDLMRMFYVGLSRAKNLLVLPRFTHGKSASEVFKGMIFNDDFTEIGQFKLSTLPKTSISDEDLGKTYSYTADYLNYERCPRQYMIFRKYGFVTSRSQNQYFGTLVHQTIEDLHHLLKQNRQAK